LLLFPARLQRLQQQPQQQQLQEEKRDGRPVFQCACSCSIVRMLCPVGPKGSFPQQKENACRAEGTWKETTSLRLSALSVFW
jgi:hypothetical protein